VTARAFGVPYTFVPPQTFTYRRPGCGSPFQDPRISPNATRHGDTLETILEEGVPVDAHPKFVEWQRRSGGGRVTDMHGSEPRPSGEIRMRLYDGMSWGPTQVVSQAAAATFNRRRRSTDRATSWCVG